jgi:hypothetical protein
VEAAELRKKEFAVSVVLGACGLRLLFCTLMAASLPPAQLNHRAYLVRSVSSVSESILRHLDTSLLASAGGDEQLAVSWRQ